MDSFRACESYQNAQRALYHAESARGMNLSRDDRTDRPLVGHSCHNGLDSHNRHAQMTSEKTCPSGAGRSNAPSPSRADSGTLCMGPWGAGSARNICHSMGPLLGRGDSVQSTCVPAPRVESNARTWRIHARTRMPHVCGVPFRSCTGRHGQWPTVWERLDFLER